MKEQVPLPDGDILKELLVYRMPFGKYKGYKLKDIPTYYLEWFSTKGFPNGKLGMLLHTLFIIRTYGLSDILIEIERRVDFEDKT